MISASDKVLVLPDDEIRRRQLFYKLREYRRRLKSGGSIFHQQDCLNKVAILKTLLAAGTVSYVKTSLGRANDPNFDPRHFDGDFNVIRAYCLNNGANIVGGTGLPKLKIPG